MQHEEQLNAVFFLQYSQERKKLYNMTHVLGICIYHFIVS